MEARVWKNQRYCPFGPDCSCPLPQRPVELVRDEERILEGELGGATAFLFFSDLAKARETGENALAAGGFDRITVNVRADAGPLGNGASTLPPAAIVELSAGRLATLVKVLGGEQAGLLAGAEPSVITREVVFWDRLPR